MCRPQLDCNYQTKQNTGTWYKPGVKEKPFTFSLPDLHPLTLSLVTLKSKRWHRIINVLSPKEMYPDAVAVLNLRDILNPNPLTLPQFKTHQTIVPSAGESITTRLRRNPCMTFRKFCVLIDVKRSTCTHTDTGYICGKRTDDYYFIFKLSNALRNEKLRGGSLVEDARLCRT